MMVSVPDIMGLFAFYVFEQFRTYWNRFPHSLFEIFSGLILAKKLFAHKEHSDAKPVALNVLVMALAGTNFLAILNGIAT